MRLLSKEHALTESIFAQSIMVSSSSNFLRSLEVGGNKFAIESCQSRP